MLGLALLLAAVLTTPWHPLAGPVPGGPVPPRVAGDFTAEEVARARAYRSLVRPVAWTSLALGLVLTLLLGLTPLGAGLVRAVAAPFGGAWWAQVLLGAVALTLLGRLLALPFDARVLVVARRYGLSVQSWRGWAVDVVKGWAVGAVLLAAVLLAVVGLARWRGGWWWVPAAVGAALLVVALSFAYPLVFEPLFNRFTPMPAGPLRAELLELAERDGVPVSYVLVADASRRTTALNAYVSGLGATRRVVVYDTLLQQADPAEVRLVVAHELGHAERRDVLHGTLLGALGAAAGVCVLAVLLGWAPLLRRAGVDGLADGRSVALVLALATLLSAVGGPFQQLVSRRLEARADVHALDLTQDPRTFALMQRRLAVANLSDLTPPVVAHVLFTSHPTGPQRIALARDWARVHAVPEPASLAP
ncbi:MAG: M48 family metalloprotease [Motilibacteraceae bacterium]